MASPTEVKSMHHDSHIELAVPSKDDAIMTDADVGASDSAMEAASLPIELPAGSTTEGATDSSSFKSRPPSPPTRPDSPYADYPLRLQPYIPPPNFGAVMDHKVFRSAFPQDRNMDFLEALGVKTLMCFVDTEPSEGYSNFVQTKGVSRHRIDISPNKEGKVKTSSDSICKALLIVLDAANHPLYIHCNQGRHRTGCVIACLRKVQGWPIEAITAEYEAYANPKMRDGDLEFIRNVFQPESLLEYAKQHGQFEHRPSLMSLLHSGLLDLDKFVRVLGSTDGIAPSNASLKSDVSKPDSGIDLSASTVDPAMLADSHAKHDPRESEVSVEECGPMSPPVSRETGAMDYLA
ncbi:hypothetical protein Q7P37_008840 [Cladosporium fusiforme]